MDNIDGKETPALVSVVADNGAPITAVATREGLWRHQTLAGYRNVLELVRDWARAGPAVTALLTDSMAEARPLLGATVTRLLTYPSKVLCSGPNYRDHLAEMGESSLGEEWTPYFFFKPPTTTLRGPGEPFEMGADVDQVDWEGELAVVIGKGGRDIPQAEARSHIAGFTVANDISLRGPHRRRTPAAPFQWDWVASKAADGSLPLGPGLVPASLVPDPQALTIRTVVDATTRQDGSTSDMVFEVDALVTYASQLVTLEAGDIILTGTPSGVGASTGTFLAPGQTVTVSIPGIGSLSTPIVRRKVRNSTWP